MRRCAAAVLGMVLALILVSCGQEEQARSLTAVGIDTCVGMVTDCFTRGEGEVFAVCIEVDTGDGEVRLFALPEAGTPGVAAEVCVGDKVRIESDSGEEAYRLVRVLEVTEHRPVLTEPPALTVAVGESDGIEAGKGTWSWHYREGRDDRCSIACGASPLEWAELPALVLSPAEMPHDEPLRIYLRFESMPDLAEAAYWDGDCRGRPGVESTALPVTFDGEAGCFCMELPDIDCIYEIHAIWEERPEGYDGAAWYAFCTELPAYTP